MYQKEIICGTCNKLEDIGSNDTGKCRMTEKLHDIMEVGCCSHSGLDRLESDIF